MTKEANDCEFCEASAKAGAKACWSCGKPINRSANGLFIPRTVNEGTSSSSEAQPPDFDLTSVLDSSSNPQPQTAETRPTKRCPYCAEDIKFEASVCRFCNRDVTPVPPIAPAVPASALPPRVPAVVPPKSNSSFGTWGCGCLVAFALFCGLVSMCNPSHNDSSSSTSSTTDAPVNNTTPYSPSPEPTPDNSPKLKVMSWSWHREYGYLIAEGEVKNISSESISQAQAVVTFMDGNGDMVKTGEALIEYDPILAGQTSPFKAMASDNPEVKTARLEFQELMGGTIPSTEVSHDEHNHKHKKGRK